MLRFYRVAEQNSALAETGLTNLSQGTAAPVGGTTIGPRLSSQAAPAGSQLSTCGCVSNPEQQAALMLHRTRDLLVRQRTMLVNALRGHLAEYGIIAPPGIPSVPKLVALAEKARGVPCRSWRGAASA
jgi:hypothetical protein